MRKECVCVLLQVFDPPKGQEVMRMHSSPSVFVLSAVKVPLRKSQNMSHNSVKMRLRILFSSSSLVIWAHTHTHSYTLGTNYGTGERRVYIADLFWKPASSLSLLSLATYCGASPESCLFISLPPARGAAVCRLCCVLIDEMLELSWDFWCESVCVYLCMFDCGYVCEHLAGRMSTYWISDHPTALVSKSIRPGVCSLRGLWLHGATCFTHRWSVL